MPRRILLVGMMGVGKSTVGRLVAGRVGARYLDSDDEVRRRTGRTVPELWRERGETAFRAEESAALVEACASEDDVVVGVAGGAVLDPANRELLRVAGDVVWLRASIDTIARRVGDGRTRPLLADDPRGALERLYPAREPLYRDLADVVVDVDDVPPEVVAGRIVESLLAR